MVLALLAVPLAWGSDVGEIVIRDGTGIRYGLPCSGGTASSGTAIPQGAMVFIVYTPTKNDPAYRSQLKLLSGSESLWETAALLYVTASPTFERRDAYFVGAAAAKSLTDTPAHFSTMLLDPHCRRISQTSTPITSADLLLAASRARGRVSNNRLERRVAASLGDKEGRMIEINQLRFTATHVAQPDR